MTRFAVPLLTGCASDSGNCMCQWWYPPRRAIPPEDTALLGKDPLWTRQRDGAVDDLVEHPLVELAGEGVLLARMERTEQRVRTDLDCGAVREHRTGTPCPVTQGRQRAQRPVPRERPQRNQDANAVQQLDLADQEGQAIVPLGRRRAVRGRTASVHRGDVDAI